VSGNVIAVDFDRTLNHHEKWESVEHTGEPIPEMVEACKLAMARGYKVVIFTARVAPRADGSHIRAAEVIRDWTRRVFGRELEVTCTKTADIVEIWDDLACGIERNTGRFLSPSRVLGPQQALPGMTAHVKRKR
jgi:hypothetical protein